MNAKSIKKSSASRTNITKLRRKDDKSINYEDSPATTGMASRIPGITPAAISLLLVHLKKSNSL